MNTLTAGMIIGLGFSLCACTGIPRDLAAVGDFDIERYRGHWYEIARLDHRFERGLSQVTATYTLRKDGGINVINRGYNRQKERYKEATGKAYFINEPTTGRLKVSFFGPFYGGYNIIALDKVNYSWAMISGPSRKYLWILAREKNLAPEIVNRLVAQAGDSGFPVDELIFVDHK